MAMVHNLALGKGLALECEIDERLQGGVCVLADGKRLMQVLLNLCANAIKFTQRGIVSLHAVVEGADGPLGHSVALHLIVRDTGAGIEPAKLASIFGQYTKLSDEGDRSASTGSLGLGLYLCRQLIEEQMGGAIWYESTLGEGSSAHITLTVPVTASPHPSPSFPSPSASRSPPTQGGARAPPSQILVVDDNSFNVEFATEMLRSEGHSVASAYSADEALSMVACARSAGRPFDFCLMDVNMPVKDGLEATRELRKAEEDQLAEEAASSTDGRPPARLIVIALTASTGPGDEQRCLAAGMDHYTTKPMHMASLRRILERTTPANTQPNTPDTGDTPPDASSAVPPSAPLPPPAAALSDITPVVAGEASSTSFDRALANMGGDEKLLLTIVRKFDSRKLMSQLGELLDGTAPLSRESAAAVASKSHQLKGMCKYLEAAGAVEAAHRLEQAAKGYDGEADAAVRDAWPQLQEAIADLEREVATFLESKQEERGVGFV